MTVTERADLSGGLSARVRAWAVGRPFAANLFWASLLSVYGYVMYTTSNRIASPRAHTSILCFSWERHIPFIPAMVIPYWSIDPLYFFIPFLCTALAEIRAHARRMLLGVTVSVICFVVFPMHFAFPRPAINGWAGPMFRFLYVWDDPVNLVPSMHVLEAALLWVIASAHTTGWTRRFIQFWFLLIIASTLLVWQHHVPDVLTGLGLALVCFYLFPYPKPEAYARDSDPAAPRNLKVARRYVYGAIAFTLIAILSRPWGLLLLWPAIAFAIVAGGYFRWGGKIFRKTGPRLPASTWFVLWPYLLGDRVAYLFYRRAGEPYAEVAPGLWVGRRLSRREARALRANGIASVLDLSAEFSASKTLRSLTYQSLPILDLTVPSPTDLEEAIKFIRTHLPTGGVYVHCTMGFSRSAAVAAAWLMASAKAHRTYEAIEAVKTIRPHARLGPAALKGLSDWKLLAEKQMVYGSGFKDQSDDC